MSLLTGSWRHVVLNQAIMISHHFTAEHVHSFARQSKLAQCKPGRPPQLEQGTAPSAKCFSMQTPPSGACLMTSLTSSYMPCVGVLWQISASSALRTASHQKLERSCMVDRSVSVYHDLDLELFLNIPHA